MSSSTTRHNSAAWLLIASLIGFTVLVINGVSEASSGQKSNAMGESEDNANMLLDDDPDALLEKPAEPLLAPDDSAPDQ